MKKILVAFCVTIFLAACGDDSSSTSVNENSSDSKEISSSSVEQKEDSLSSHLDSLSCKTKTEDNCEYGSLKDDRDGQTYKTVKIGDLWWMAENLNYSDSVNTPSLLGRSWCYDNKPENCAAAGRLYVWSAAIDSVKLAADAENPQECGYGKVCSLPEKLQGICPSGWHLPINDEWRALVAEAGGDSLAGMMLKAKTGWNLGGEGIDGIGFSAVPTGRYKQGVFEYDNYAYFWSANSLGEENGLQQDPYMVSLMLLYSDGDESFLTSIDRNYGHAIRCVKN
ncbi:major paralogous domain-containing protein [Fibrobacter sp. UWB15]|uniref:fibrobacter succinogenes major paralogous domain-containing protein n=1 Tax=unclassified Fibrobacter TaxID=2634177 RepID=UPI000917C072|nr:MULTISPECIES: fibrobacter succinogenes major paralogous domain-containing protein [unclassified Fibrobacter]PWJ64522.1 uncharacterized protein (TIGR02145 family) [Fibrobacter sp. UWB6]SHG15961.1 major paralogous domain-containing protein [Fibrobacter sp. UWB8]SMG32349.1 major paralogous domain-containing protein [Fibrobacter sp. UWB15]